MGKLKLPGAMLALSALAAALAVLAPTSVQRLTKANAAGATVAPASTDTAPSPRRRNSSKAH